MSVIEISARAKINDLLSRLKQKEVELRNELDTETNEDRQKELEQKIDLVHSQRKKGISMVIELKNEDHG